VFGWKSKNETALNREILTSVGVSNLLHEMTVVTPTLTSSESDFHLTTMDKSMNRGPKIDAEFLNIPYHTMWIFYFE